MHCPHLDLPTTFMILIKIYPPSSLTPPSPGKITSRINLIHRTMANIGYFQVPADDVGRAKKFYQSLLGWKLEPDTTLENKTLEWQNIITGEPETGTMNAGGPVSYTHSEPTR